MSGNYKTCKLCSGRVAADHEGQVCPLCGRETLFNYVMTTDAGHYTFTGQPATLKRVAEWWVWNWPYLVILIFATLGSLISGFIPGWGGAVNVVCTIVAVLTGFKAGVKYHREIIR